MRLFDLFEATIPATQYGYWITPAGQCIGVPFQGHEEVIEQQANLSLDDALLDGWIRVITHARRDQPRLIADMFLGRPTARAVSMLRRIMRSEQFDRYEVELGHADHTKDLDAWKSFESQAAFAAYVTRAASAEPIEPRLDEGAAPPSTDYGYWIDPQGNYYSVPFQQHHVILAKISIETLGYKLTNHNAMREGWIRVIDAADGELSVECYAHRITARGLSALRSLAKDPTLDSFVVSVHEADRASNIGYGKSFTELRPFLQYMQQVRQPNSSDEPINEAAVRTTDYGYWITDQGEIIPVTHYGHEDELDRRGFGTSYMAYEKAYYAGWVRLVTDNGLDVPTMMIQFMAGSLSLRATSAVRQVARQSEFHSFHVDVTYNFELGLPSKSKSLSNIAAMLALLNENRRPNGRDSS